MEGNGNIMSGARNNPEYLNIAINLKIRYCAIGADKIKDKIK